jgi:hypothetical protein
VNAIGIAYLATNAMAMAGFIIQLVGMLRDRQSRLAVPLSAWFLWSAAYAVEVIYIWPAPNVGLAKIVNTIYCLLSLAVLITAAMSRLCNPKGVPRG